MMKNIITILLLILVFTSCSEDFLDQSSKDLTTDTQIDDYVTNPENAKRVVAAIEAAQIARFKDDDIGEMMANTTFDFMTDGYAGKLGFSGARRGFSYSAKVADNSINKRLWVSYYKTIYDINAALNGILKNAPDEEGVNQVRARFRGMRAYCYFRLAQMYQHTYTMNPEAPGVPMYDGADLDNGSRSTLRQVYDFIIEDIDWAYNNIGDYSSTKEYLNKHSIAGIYARILVETGRDYEKAATLAREAQEGGALMTREEFLEGLNDINNVEVLWGGENNMDRNGYSFFNNFFSTFYRVNVSWVPFQYKLEIDVNLTNSISETDWRKEVISEAYRSYKFKTYPIEAYEDSGIFLENRNEYVASSQQGDFMYMRVAEMYLLEAEALARAGQTGEATTVLTNFALTRDPNYTIEGNLLDAIYKQRKIELWGEGHGLFDMKRFGKGMTRDYPDSRHRTHTDPETGESMVWNYPANSSRFVFQIPKDEILANPEISQEDQNPM